MPILSWEGHLEQMMSLVQIKALRGFVHDRKIVEVGDTLTVTKGFARTLIAAHQAALVVPVEPPKPSAAVVRREPDLATQLPDTRPRKAKD